MSNSEKIIDVINSALEKNYINLKINNSNLDKQMKETGIDSIVVISIVTEIEEKFSIVLPDDELMSLKTPRDLLNLVEKTLSSK